MTFLIPLLAVSVFSVPLAFADSTISRTYERSIYDYSSGVYYEALRYRVELSIQTEWDGTWRKGNTYHGTLAFCLDWFSTEHFPRGVTMVVIPPMADPNLVLNITYHEGNLTLFSVTQIQKWEIDFTLGLSGPSNETYRFRLLYKYYIYNYTIANDLTLIEEGSFIAPDVYLSTPSNYIPTSQQITDVSSQIQGLRDLFYVLIALVTVSIVVQIVQVVRGRSGKENQTPSIH